MDDEPTHVGSSNDTPPLSIAGYRILDKVGSGGMADVYRAEQLRPVRRVVAIKVIKPGMDSRQVIARFDSERQALALMNHTNIARVFDAGATDQGHPYLTMELVEGTPIDAYCDANGLTTRERLELFVQVCEGVQHAHQKGIIHRDIKPSNVLVTIQGETAVPKIIDFGVARATAFQLADQSARTELGQLVGTPAFMSPEQAEMTGLDIDTRTDVYSLGVLLYRLLVGTLPFDVREALKSGWEGVRRKILEEEPPRPSTRATTIDKSSASAAELRRSERHALARSLRGDLDWIIMKALEKDRTRRYASVSELAGDVLRHLRDEPVLAGPPGTLYRLRKYARRHRLGMSFSLILVLLVASFGVAMALQTARLAHERDRANQQATFASQEARTAREVTDFLVGLFELSDPSEARGNSVTAREILDQGAARVDRELAEQPLVQARFMEVIGHVYRSLGLFDRGRRLLSRALEIRRRLQPEHDPSRLRCRTELGALLVETGNFEDARPLLEGALRTAEATLGADDPELASILRNLALMHYELGEYERAFALYERTLRIHEDRFGSNHERVAQSLDGLAQVRLKQLDHDAALSLFERALRIRERALAPDHPDVARNLENLAVVYRGLRDEERALPLYRRALEIHREIYGPRHPVVARNMLNLGNLYFDAEDFDTALDWYRRSLEIRRERFGPNSPDVAESLNNIAAVHFMNEKYEEARSLYEEVLWILRSTRGSDHIDVAEAEQNLALLDRRTGELASARERLERVIAIRSEVLGPDHPEVGDAWNKLCNVHHDERDYARAEEALNRARAIWDLHGDARAAKVRYNLACLAALQGDPERAVRLLRQAIERGYLKSGMFEDPDLDSLRGRPEFESLVAEYGGHD